MAGPCGRRTSADRPDDPPAVDLRLPWGRGEGFTRTLLPRRAGWASRSRRRRALGLPVIELVTTDGSEVERGDEVGADLSPTAAANTFPFATSSFEGEAILIEADHRWPVEAVPPDKIELALAAEIYEGAGVEDEGLYGSAFIDRPQLESDLQQSIWTVVIGLLFGALVWRLLAHGIAGPYGQRHAVVVAAAAAVPSLILPAVVVGTPAGIAAGFLMPAAVALVLGLSLARSHSEPQWVMTGMAVALVAAGLTVVLVARYLLGPSLGSGDPTTILLMLAATSVAPAAVAASATSRSVRERASLMSLGLVPAAAATLLYLQPGFEPIWPFVLVAILLCWYPLPLEARVARRVARLWHGL